MLVKLTTSVNFTDILGESFAPRCISQKLQSQSVSRENLHKALLQKAF